MNRFKLHDPDEFSYLSNGGHSIRNKSQYLKGIFNDMESSIDLIGFTAEEQENLFRVCAGLLHFGNIGFEEKEHDASCVRADCSEAMNTSCSLLGFRESLISEMMTVSVSVARGGTGHNINIIIIITMNTRRGTVPKESD